MAGVTISFELGAEGAVEIVMRRQVEEADDPAAKKAELIAAYKSLLALCGAAGMPEAKVVGVADSASASSSDTIRWSALTGWPVRLADEMRPSSCTMNSSFATGAPTPASGGLSRAVRLATRHRRSGSPPDDGSWREKSGAYAPRSSQYSARLWLRRGWN